MATRWACVGPGFIASDFFSSIKHCLPASEHEFVAVGSRDISRAQKFADDLNFKRAYGSYDEVANDKDVEVVYIGTIHVTHVELSIKMLEAGKHVLCEKPMAMNLKEAKKVFEVAKKNNRTFVEAIWTRWFPIYKQMLKEIEAGALGDISLVQANFCVSMMHVERAVNAKMGGGALLDIGIYTINLACMVFKEMPESITAVGHLSEAGDIDIGTCVILKYKNGGLANLAFHADTAEGDQTARILGTKGIIQVDAPMWAPQKIKTPAGTQEFPLQQYKTNFINSAGMHYEAAAMRDTILSGKLENEVTTHAHSEMIMTIMDEVRRQIGLKYPDFD